MATTVNDTAFPAPVLVPWSAVAVGDFCRLGDNYVRKTATTGGYDFTANGDTSLVLTQQVQVVTASLVITPPSP